MDTSVRMPMTRSSHAKFIGIQKDSARLENLEGLEREHEASSEGLDLGER
jgi:hypothetical protein